MLLAAGTVLTGRELWRPGWIETSGSEIRDLGAGDPPRPADREFPVATVVPGFVDIHNHGGGGASFSGGHDETVAAVALHRRHGTTTLVASLVTEPPGDLLRQVSALAGDVQSGLIAGIHLEGPWLAEKRCGAHDPTLLRDPDPAELSMLLDAAGGTIRMVTLAPERAGALEAIVETVIASNAKNVAEFQAGNGKARNALVPQSTATRLMAAPPTRPAPGRAGQGGARGA